MMSVPVSVAAQQAPGTAVAPLRNRLLLVALASAFINTTYGTLSYSFSVLVTSSAAGGAFGVRQVSFAFAAALLVSGVASVGAGAVADLFGSRRLMAAGSVVGAAALCLIAASTETWQLVMVSMFLLGPAMAATFYEPVYVLMNQWFAPAERPRAYGLLTMMSGISITIFIPLTRLLVSEFGWRQAVVGLAAILLTVGLIVPALLRSGPTDLPTARASNPLRTFLPEIAAGLRTTNRPFWAFAIASFVAGVAFSGSQFHMVAQLETRGFDENAVSTAIGLTGVVSLPLRFLLPSLSARLPGPALLAGCFVVLGVAAGIASVASEWWQVWMYVAVYGLVFGAVYPLRALVTSERFAGPYFGRVLGVLALTAAVSRALGPAIVGLAGSSRAAYATSFQVAGVTMAIAGIACWLALRRAPRSSD